MRLFLVSLLALPSLVAAQNTRPAASDTIARRVAHAARRSGDISIDGRLDEAAWASATPSSGFVQSYPKPGAPAPDPTEVRVLYDDAALYVGVRMHDSHPDSIAAQLARRDASGIFSDWVHVIIDSYHDRRTGFRFSVNPKGVKKDVYTSNDGAEDINWDAVWDVGTRIDSMGWTAEYRIPLSQIRFGSAPAGAERIWGFQVQRDVARRSERDTWSPWTKQEPGFVSRFGDLAGLVNIPRPSRLEIQPYVSARATRAPGNSANPFYSKTDFTPSVGGDLRYGLPGGLTLTATVNPDFGQVEVDPSVVNLSAFETFFPEKRPFFLEGSDVFTFGQVTTHNDFGSQRYFYSRRIGRQPQLFPGASNIEFADVPGQTTIAGAAKVTGKVGPWTLGVIDGVTPEEHADVRLSDGSDSESPVEPFTNYFAGRARRDFRNGGSVIGGMVTSTMRNVDDDVFKDVLRRNASFGGIDFEHSMRKREWVASGYLAGTRVTGSASSIASTQLNSTHYYQRPQADYIEFDANRTSLDGHIGELAIAHNGSVFGSLAYKEASPGLELNDMGFSGRVDYRATSALIGYQNFTAGKTFRNFDYYGFANQAYNFGGLSIIRSGAVGADMTFLNLWSLGLKAGGNPSYYSDRFTRGGPDARQPSSWYAGFDVGSDNRKPVVYGGGVNYRRNESGGFEQSAFLNLTYRPTTSLRLSFSPSYSGGTSTGQYVRAVTDALATTTFGRRYVFADIDQTTLSMDTRVEWTFTPTLSLQMYAQPFVATGDYKHFKEFLTPKEFDFAVYGSDKGAIAKSASGVYTVDPDAGGPATAFQFGDPNFNVRSLRGNAVVRWEYRPGSALFFVWQQERSGFEPIGDFSASRDIGEIFKTRPTNVFLVKATYWLGR
ncbi:MAG TPA: DUF5916 domain-containing protein [Gemmatimonadaceae bacterium]|nr:DUF5916 domain-containing protein [Gemmatimonadaceae bacterium]